MHGLPFAVLVYCDHRFRIVEAYRELFEVFSSQDVETYAQLIREAYGSFLPRKVV